MIWPAFLLLTVSETTRAASCDFLVDDELLQRSETKNCGAYGVDTPRGSNRIPRASPARS
jgi:hypothetical protein